MYLIGVDVGGTKVNVGIVNEAGTVLAGQRIPTAGENLAGRITDTAGALLSGLSLTAEEITAAGVCVPGTVSGDGKTVLKMPNLPVDGTELVREIGCGLGLPVLCLQDSRAAAFGEALVGAAKDTDVSVTVTLGTGIGTGIVMHGEIYGGAGGAAGEMGHLPAVPGGRPCGCGKCGCLEKYAAGGGLSLTAAEMYGEGKDAAYLFAQAEAGDVRAKEAILEAVRMLSDGLVSVLNLLSPDCLLLGGGLSLQRSLFTEPLMDALREKCYSAGQRIPKIAPAALGEDAPMIGAALYARSQYRRRPVLSASFMCADILHLGDSLRELESAEIGFVHYDIMDNHFVPNLMLPDEIVPRLRAVTDMPFDFHIMTEKPETVVARLDLRPGDFVSIHYESTVHLQRVLALVRDRGAIPAVALNPATPIECLAEVLDDVGMILLMTVNPGFAGQKIVPAAIEKVKKVRRMLADLGRTDILIEVDGNCSFENVPKLHRAGADVFVVGSSSVFHKDYTVKTATEKLFRLMDGCE